MKKPLSPKVLLSPPLELVPKQGRLKKAKPVHTKLTGRRPEFTVVDDPHTVVDPTADLPTLD